MNQKGWPYDSFACLLYSLVAAWYYSNEEVIQFKIVALEKYSSFSTWQYSSLVVW